MSILTYNISQKPFVFEHIIKILKGHKKNKKFIFIDYPHKQESYLKFFPNTKNHQFISHNIFIKLRFPKKNFFYLGVDFYKKFIFSEKIYMAILSRYQKDQNTFSYYDRLNFYHKILEYYGDFLISNKIKSIIFYDYPHHIDSYPLYILAKYLKIKIIIVSYLFLMGHYRVVIDVNLKNRFAQFYSSLNFEINKKKILEKIDIYIKTHQHIKPKYIQSDNSLLYFFIKDIYRAFKNGFFKESNFYSKVNPSKNYFEESISSELKSVFINFNQRLKIKKMKNAYLKLCSSDYLKIKNYVLFLPSVQPEASTLPLAGYFNDFKIIIDMLLKYLPKDWLILYKEHPLTFNLSKESYLFKKHNYYDQIKNDRIVFIDYKIDTYNLISNSKCVATATGSAGLEASLKGKPVLNFGVAWWSNFKNIYTIQSDDDLKKALNLIKLNKFEFNINELKKQILKTFQKTIEFDLYEEESFNEYLIKKDKLDVDFKAVENYFKKNLSNL